MKLRGLVEEDFLQYKKPAMFLIMPYCSFKCDLEANNKICQNSELIKTDIIDIAVDRIINKYVDNPITKAVVFGGLEPMDSWEDLITFIRHLRVRCDDDIVIYTGYKNDEIEDKIDILKNYKNIIVKFGRFIPGQEPHLDPVLQVSLASLNQYAVKIS